MSIASVFLLALVVGLLFFDFATLRQAGKRVFFVECAAFGAGGVLIAFPDLATRLAHFVGIGRGVDFVLYPLVIWLVRESLVSRRRRWEDAQRLTEVVRAMAIQNATVIEARNDGAGSARPGQGTKRAPAH